MDISIESDSLVIGITRWLTLEDQQGNTSTRPWNGIIYNNTILQRNLSAVTHHVYTSLLIYIHNFIKSLERERKGWLNNWATLWNDQPWKSLQSGKVSCLMMKIRKHSRVFFLENCKMMYIIHTYLTECYITLCLCGQMWTFDKWGWKICSFEANSGLNFISWRSSQITLHCLFISKQSFIERIIVRSPDTDAFLLLPSSFSDPINKSLFKKN